ncbi:class I SAM-dependent methyltransferase [Nakamurella flavida]|uniref:Class I SAM-dependent methyltransferase n=1 Tax=Nakamurella flavida TaxID=363630 RepID=A0A938YNV3_9ACTN|nr:class I SAM-dependent methyltransferase [Nakamurella flavida]MBM9476659.1 class I SAM-dependent methyltransferase [Nakamurella flavida]MDP9778903.1 SAM-dependent methyltransferase [Nakamurella flavida]
MTHHHGSTQDSGRPAPVFDKPYWEEHWDRPATAGQAPVNPHLVRETATLTPGTALDAGCGVGTEARWLAGQGWQVTGADISGAALAAARDHAGADDPGDRPTWIEVDLGIWEPRERWDLVVSHYAHPAIPQLDFHRRLAGWVAPGGTLLIVGHRHGPGGHGQEHHGDHPPAEATATTDGITALLAGGQWRIDTAREVDRVLPGHGRTLQDVVVRATRLR